jgi:zinc protease
LKKFGEIEYYDVEGNKIEAPTVSKVAIAPVGITAESIISKYIVAIGGKDKLLAVKDLVMNLSGNIPNGPAIVTTITKKLPNKSLQEVKVMGNVMQKTVIDGQKGMVTSRGQDAEIKETELKQAIAKGTLFYEADLVKAGIKATLIGIEKIEGVDCNKIEFSSGDSKWIEFFNAATSLKMRSVENRNTANGVMQTIVDYSNYKETNGLKFPTIIRQNNGQFQIELTLDSVKMNTGVEDKLFIIK